MLLEERPAALPDGVLAGDGARWVADLVSDGRRVLDDVRVHAHDLLAVLPAVDSYGEVERALPIYLVEDSPWKTLEDR